MKPGRELDAKVAEAMGWQDIQPNTNPPYGTHPNGTTAVIPHYSIHWPDAAKAWEWLENHYLARYKGKYTMALGRLREEQPLIFLEKDSEVHSILTRGDTYPHAICLAILILKESDEL